MTKRQVPIESKLANCVILLVLGGLGEGTIRRPRGVLLSCPVLFLCQEWTGVGMKGYEGSNRSARNRRIGFGK